VHPDLQHALAREHQAELLRHHQFRHRDRTFAFASLSDSDPRLVGRLRHSLGRAFVVVGVRLLRSSTSNVLTVELFDTEG
jgi:hypothetical protein